MEYNSFPGWLQTKMAENDMSQADLAKKAKVSRAAISNVLNGYRRPGPELCRAIAKALDLPAESVFREAGLLDDLPSRRELFDEIVEYRLTLLTDVQIDEVMQFIEFIQMRDERKGSE